MDPITIVTFIWTGERGYKLKHAAAVEAAIARHATFPYRFVVISDQAPKGRFSFEVMPLPQMAIDLPTFRPSPGYYSMLPKLWLFSGDARCLGKRIFYLDADSIVTGDLEPIVTYAPEASFVCMLLPNKLQSAMFMLETGALTDVWATLTQELQEVPFLRGYHKSDQLWLRHRRLEDDYPHWPNREMGIYLLKDLDVNWPLPPLPDDARIVHPTGKTKPWNPIFTSRYPWAEEHYKWTT